MTQKLLLFVLLALISGSDASEPSSPVEPEQYKSHDWWRGLAVHYADEIADDEARGQAHYELAYVRARAGDLDGASVSATRIKNPQLRVYAHCFAAKHYHQKGDDDACRSELQHARKAALEAKKAMSIFANSHVIEAYLKMGNPADALSFVAEIPNDQQQRSGFRKVAATLAQRGELNQATEIVKRHFPPNRQEGVLASIAYACAREARIEEVRELAGQLTNVEYRDNTYVNLVNALVRGDRHGEAVEFADQVSDPVRKAAAHATITGRSIKDENAEALESRIEEATTREEKLVLYDALFTKLVEAGNVAAAETVLESMAETIEASPREAQASKFGTFDDAGAIAGVRAKYMETAKLLAQEGDREGSLLRIARARKAVTDLAEQAGLAKMMLVATLVKSLIDVGDLDGARATLSEIEQDFSRSSAAADLAVALIQSGDVKSALDVADLITAPIGKGLAVGSVVSELVRAGQLAAAKGMLAKLGDSKEEARAFRAVGRTMLELERGPELHQWLNEMTSNVARAHTCIGAAEPPRAQ